MKCKCCICHWAWSSRLENRKPKECPRCKRHEWDNKTKKRNPIKK